MHQTRCQEGWRIGNGPSINPVPGRKKNGGKPQPDRQLTFSNQKAFKIELNIILRARPPKQYDHAEIGGGGEIVPPIPKYGQRFHRSHAIHYARANCSIVSALSVRNDRRVWCPASNRIRSNYTTGESHAPNLCRNSFGCGCEHPARKGRSNDTSSAIAYNKPPSDPLKN